MGHKIFSNVDQEEPTDEYSFEIIDQRYPFFMWRQFIKFNQIRVSDFFNRNFQNNSKGLLDYHLLFMKDGFRFDDCFYSGTLCSGNMNFQEKELRDIRGYCDAFFLETIEEIKKLEGRKILSPKLTLEVFLEFDLIEK